MALARRIELIAGSQPPDVLKRSRLDVLQAWPANREQSKALGRNSSPYDPSFFSLMARERGEAAARLPDVARHLTACMVG